METILAATVPTTSGAPSIPRCARISATIGSRSLAVMSSRKTLGMPGGALLNISAIMPRCTRKTVSVNITPIPRATSAACA